MVVTSFCDRAYISWQGSNTDPIIHGGFQRRPGSKTQPL